MSEIGLILKPSYVYRSSNGLFTIRVFKINGYYVGYCYIGYHRTNIVYRAKIL